MTAENGLDCVGVVGSGLMGAEIALVFALAGHDVRLVDVTQEKLTAATQRLGTLLAKGVARGFYAAEQTDAALCRIATTTNLADLADRDLVVEAVFEQEAAKAKIFTNSIRSAPMTASSRRALLPSRSRFWRPTFPNRAARVSSARTTSRQPPA